MIQIKRFHLLLIVLILVVCAIPFRVRLRSAAISVIQILKGKKTVAERVEQYGEAVRVRLGPDFERVGVAYPPKQIVLVGLKQEGLLEVWVSGDDMSYRLLKTYPITAESGTLGPKLNEGDEQIPEGLYKVESLNPNSMFHLAIRINFPNDFDRKKGNLEGRNNLGTDIMIHGKDCSVGCLAMGDPAAEDLFVLAADTGIENISVILSPVDFRRHDFSPYPRGLPDWTPELYGQIKVELAKLREDT